MTTTELEQVILTYFKELYCLEYIGKIKVTEEDGLYTLSLGLNTPEKPLFIVGKMDETSFLKYVKTELHNNRLDHTKYFTGYQIYKDNDER